MEQLKHIKEVKVDWSQPSTEPLRIHYPATDVPDLGILETNEYLEYERGVSNCCSAPIYRDQGICADCKEHCGEMDPD